jgi:aminopeptidase N
MTKSIRASLLAATATIGLALGACTTTTAVPPAMGPGMPVIQTPASVDTIDLNVPTQLPRVAIPRHYDLSVVPDAANLKFDGKVKIDVDVVTATNTLTLNAADLTFRSATITGPGGMSQTATATTDDKAQTATFAVAQPLAPGRYQLALDYSGIINTQAHGLFALDYKDKAGAAKRSLFTQFEAPDARRFVPSWDEPDYKATWDLTATIPAGQMAVSNMPAANTVVLPDGRQQVTFQTSPTMSSYLLFFGAGDFGRVTKMAGNTEVGIVMSKGNEAQAQTALDAEAQILPYYNDYFGVPFPLPKLDNVAGPGQSQFFGAMENWGSIFTFEYVLLDDPSITTESQRQSIFEVEAHEMAHQWFGDLVTMAWWDDLWLNEGFASWMENRTTHHFHPDWGADIDKVGGREAAMGLDSFKTTHPVVQTIRTVEQSNQAFDTITYQKGQSVIGMLEGFTGGDVWQRGIQAYMKAHAYKNSRTDDLWAAIEGAGGTGVTQIAHDFTLQPGIPLIRVGKARCVGGTTQLSLTQSEFARDRKPGSFTPLSWHVPVTAQTLGGAIVRTITQGPVTDLSVPGCGALLVNAGQTGYFRTLYQPEQVAALSAGFAQLGPVDQFGMFSDNYQLSIAGYQPMGRSLDLLKVIPTNGNPKLAGLALGTWSGMHSLLKDDKAMQARIARQIVARFGPLLQQIGMAPRAGEPAMVAVFRPQLIAALGRAGDTRVLAESRRLFANPAMIPGSLKTTWLAVMARSADAATWDTLHGLAKNAGSATERAALYNLLASSSDPTLLRRALDLALTGEPGQTNSAAMIRSAASSDPDLTLDYVLAHQAQVTKFIDKASQSRFIPGLAAGSSRLATIDKLEAYAKANIAPTDRKPVEQAIGSIRQRLESRPRILAETKAWISENRL